MDFKSTALGIGSGAMFALSAIGYRGAIRSLDGAFFMASSFTLAVGLAIQAGLLYDLSASGVSAPCWPRSCKRGGRRCSPASWVRWHRHSGFSPSRWRPPPRVRTLALVEVVFAQAVSLFVFRQRVSRATSLGVVLVVIGVGLLLRAT